MEIREPIGRLDINQHKKISRVYNQFDKLLVELRERELPEEIVISINSEIENMDLVSGSEKEMRKQIRRTQSRVLKLIEKKLKLVPKKHYLKTWLMVGMAVFGLPFGVAFGASFGNMGLLGVGLPIGMAIGIAVGSAMDKKAFDTGKQLDLEIKY